MAQKTATQKVFKDVSAGVVVFLVALPLCLGIALASGAPSFSGIIAGVVGGIVVGFISGSRLGVSGPAAGLIVIVATAITDLGDYRLFLVAVVIGGILQLILGLIGAGKIAFYFPSSVIKGMLAAIGITIILKQIPHAFGIDQDPEGDLKFMQEDGETTFSELFNLVDFVEGALIIGAICMIILILWERDFIKKNAILGAIPGPLVAVLTGTLINAFYPVAMQLESSHLVTLPTTGLDDFSGLFTFPDFNGLKNFEVYRIGFLIAIIASLETLLCVEATDKLDPNKNITPTNKELIAQGAGNMVSGLVGGLPVTQVIVRSSANIQAGGLSRKSTIFHGIFLIVSVIFIPMYLNMIPLAALAAVLIMVGYKLSNPALYKKMFLEGQDQFIPFIVTIVAILFTDLLIGILIGLMVGIGYVIFTNFRSAIKKNIEGNHVIVDFKKDVFFYNRAELMEIFSSLSRGDELTLDGRNVDFMDHDIFLAIEEYVQDAKRKDIKVNVLDITRKKLGFRDKDKGTLTLKND